MNVAGIHPDGKFLIQVMEIARDLTDKKLLLTGVEYAHQIERYSVVWCDGMALDGIGLDCMFSTVLCSTLLS